MLNERTSSHWLDRSLIIEPAKLLKLENIIVFLILLLAVISRFAILGERVMSHDEVNHVVPSYELYQGRGYRHDPITHGPFQFHIVALTYFMFGDSDFTSRIPAATFSVAAVAFVIFAYRRYLGRYGALIAGFLFVISPYMLFYGRYTRNEAFIQLFGVIMLYAMLRYLQTGERFPMFLFTFSVVMHFITKETSFIYTAQALIFLALMFLVEVRRIMHRDPALYNRFLLLIAVALLLVMAALAVGAIKATNTAETPEAAQAAETVEPAAPAQTPLQQVSEAILLAGAAASGLYGIFLLARRIGWDQLKGMRSFSLLILTGSLILPMLAPFPVKMLGWNPIDYATSASIARTAAFVAAFFIIGIAIGWWWNPRLWLLNAFLFYSIFIVFYTTFFTNGFGFFTGIVGSLGYWLAQQGVERGSQPWYYYGLVQLPIYEFIAIFGTLLAVYFAVRYNRFFQMPGYSLVQSPQAVLDQPAVEGPISIESDATAASETTFPTPEYTDRSLAVSQTLIAQKADPEVATAAQSYAEPEPTPQTNYLTELYAVPRPLPVMALLLFWSITSLVAFSIAGEKMPWLTVHIALPMLLASGWGLGFLIERVEWKHLASYSGLIAVLLLPVLFAGFANILIPLTVGPLPFQGNTLDQLQSSSRFVMAVLAFFASGTAILYLLRDWRFAQILSLVVVTFFALMAVLTGRAAYRASYINYDTAKEYLVYAHAARGPKDILAQVNEISHRLTGGKDVKVAYSNDGLYPYWWYFRDYPNHYWYQNKPTRELREYPLIIAGDDVIGKIESVVGDNYIRYDYMRLWWPNQDYWNLTSDRLWGAISDPAMRAAIFDIWLNRDYTSYGQLTGKEKELDLESWSPGARVRFYVRKDIAAQIWNYGAAPAVSQEELDPYASKLVNLTPQQVINLTGNPAGALNAPRGLSVAQDGSLYVADSRNHRILHLAPSGELLKAWGTFADKSKGDAPGGTFYEPWDVAVSPDGSVFVSDTWNHRIQKFTADGQFVKEWGYFGQAEAPDAFWGPRGIAFDAQGRLFVMDTGNSRVVIFDADGNFVNQFGAKGLEQGEFDEPVDIAIDQTNGSLFITDTWNQRIQQFAPIGNGLSYSAVQSWDVSGWNGQSLDNKPFIAVSPTNGHIYVTDPEAPRILEFDQQGAFVRGWGQFSNGPDGFGLASGVAVDQDGGIWVTDGANNLILKFAP